MPQALRNATRLELNESLYISLSTTTFTFVCTEKRKFLEKSVKSLRSKELAFACMAV